MSSAPDLTSRILRHERVVIAGTIMLLAGLSWAFVARGAGMSAMQPPLTALILMWWLMMVAMMLPAAGPAIMLYARVRDMRGGPAGPAIARTWVFLAGYLALWLLFSIAAALAETALTGSSMKLDNRRAGGAVLIASGLYQLSPLKSLCVSHCRSPVQFISRYWRGGWQGALTLGLRHGVYCVGCCWLLMALLFVGGIMNLLWIAGLTLLVAGEKLLAHGETLARLSGAALIGWGVLELSL